jgi:hypothetical protein
MSLACMAKEVGGVKSNCLPCCPTLTGDKCNGRLHCGPHPLNLVDAIEAALAAVFVLGDGANRLDVRADIGGDALAVSTYPAFQVDKMIGVADGFDALFDLLPLLGQSHGLTAGRCKGLLRVFKAHGRFWRMAWAAPCKLISWTLKACLSLIKFLLGFGERLGRGSLFGGQRCANGFATWKVFQSC